MDHTISRRAAGHPIGGFGPLIIIVLGLVASACSGATDAEEDASSTEGSMTPVVTTSPVEDIPGCVPVCGAGGRLDPLELPEGEYRTEGFFGGAMTVSFDAGWTSPEDSSGEFAAAPNDGGGAVLFWLDVYPVERFERVKDVPLTADSLVGWLRGNPNLDVSKPTAGTIGSLPAIVVDVKLSADAKNEPVALSRAAGVSPDEIAHCSRGGKVWCAFFLGFPQWFPPPGVWSIGNRVEVQRMYFSDVTYGGRDHLFVAVVYTDDTSEEGQQEMLERGQRIIDTVHVPATAA